MSDDEDWKNKYKKMKNKYKKMKKQLKIKKNKESIQSDTEISTITPVTKLSLEEEFDLLMNKMISDQGNNEGRLKELTLDGIHILKDTPGGLEFGIHFLRAEDNMKKILNNQTFEDNLNNIRSLPAVHGLIKTVDETSELLRKRIGKFHRLFKNVSQGAKSMGNKAANAVRGIFGREKVNMVNENAMQNQLDNNANLNRNEEAQRSQGSSLRGGRKTQRKRKQKHNKHHKTRKYN
jgi:hypothetical protein